MTENRGINVFVTAILRIICIIFQIILIRVVTDYSWIIYNKESFVQIKDSQLRTLTSQKNQLQTWLDGNTTRLNAVISERDRLQAWFDGNITQYASQINSLNSQIANLQNQTSTLNSQMASLNAQITDLQSQVNALRARIDVYSSFNDIKHSEKECCMILQKDP